MSQSSPPPQPIVDPGSATVVKWSGVAVAVLVLALVAWVSGWAMVVLTAIGYFGVLMLCVGAESETPRT